MPLKLDNLEEPQLNLTPMIDVVFNLIIFFMVGTRFSDMERQLDINLPQVAAAQALSTPPDEIVINVNIDGKVIVRERTLNLQELRDLLIDAKKRYAEQAVLVRGDGQGVYQRVADVISICHGTGITNLSLAAQVSESGQK